LWKGQPEAEASWQAHDQKYLLMALQGRVPAMTLQGQAAAHANIEATGLCADAGFMATAL
jgi:hypothetical protein